MFWETVTVLLCVYIDCDQSCTRGGCIHCVWKDRMNQSPLMSAYVQSSAHLRAEDRALTELWQVSVILLYSAEHTLAPTETSPVFYLFFQYFYILISLLFFFFFSGLLTQRRDSLMLTQTQACFKVKKGESLALLDGPYARGVAMVPASQRISPKH